MVKKLKYSVGLDVSKEKINTCISVIDEQQSVQFLSSKLFSNSRAGFVQMVSWIGKYRVEAYPWLLLWKQRVSITNRLLFSSTSQAI